MKQRRTRESSRLQKNFCCSLENRAIKWAVESGYIGDVKMMFLGCVEGVEPFGGDSIIIGTR
jgi:hypothetical protein